MRSKKELQSRVITHAIVVTNEQAPFIIKSPMNLRLSTLPTALPLFPVSTVKEGISHEGEEIHKAKDLTPAHRVSPRFLSGHKLIPVTEVSRLASENDSLLLPESDELHLYTLPQVDEVVANAARCLFVGLENIRHESTAAFAFDRFTGKFVQVGSVLITELLSGRSMVPVALPAALCKSIGELDDMDKTSSLHALNDEPEPSWTRRVQEDTMSFTAWDNALGALLDSVEIARRADRQPYSGAARLAYAGWENGHPTLQTIAAVAAGEKVVARERVTEHLQKCLCCSYRTLVRAIPALNTEVDDE